MVFGCVVPFKRKQTKNSGFIAATLYILKVHLYNTDLDNMIPQGISQTSIPNPKYKLQIRK